MESRSRDSAGSSPRALPSSWCSINIENMVLAGFSTLLLFPLHSARQETYNALNEGTRVGSVSPSVDAAPVTSELDDWCCGGCTH